jgi:adenylyl cyclase-associated protein
MSADKAVSDLLARLEAVTKRLESVEKQLASGGGASTAPAAAAGGAGGDHAEPPFVTEFDDLVNQHVKQYVELSKKVNDVVHQQALLFEQAVQAERKLLLTAANSKKPSQTDLPKVVDPISKLMGQISELREKNRTNPCSNHLSAVGEGVQALGWVVISPTPGPHVNECKAQSEFWSNRILKEFKGKDELHVNWVHAFNGFLKDLIPYIKKYHTTELSWNPRGGDALSFNGGASAPASSGGAPPPPPGPPPPPPPSFDAPASSHGGNAPDTSALFAALNKGEGITSGLKKVTKDMKTKNQKDRPAAIVPAKEAKEPAAPKAAAGKAEAAKPPVFRLEGNKWLVHNQIGNKTLVITETEAKQVIYVYKCENSVIQVKGKVNNITIDNCKKTAVVFESVVSALEVVNSQSIEVQCSGKCPSYAVDKTSGVQLYLSKEGFEFEFVQAKSSEMNVLIPGATADADLIEMPIPEQFKTVFKDGKLITEPVTHV